MWGRASRRAPGASLSNRHCGSRVHLIPPKSLCTYHQGLFLQTAAGTSEAPWLPICHPLFWARGSQVSLRQPLSLGPIILGHLPWISGSRGNLHLSPHTLAFYRQCEPRYADCLPPSKPLANAPHHLSGQRGVARSETLTSELEFWPP